MGPCLPRAMPTPSHAYPEPCLPRATPSPSHAYPEPVYPGPRTQKVDFATGENSLQSHPILENIKCGATGEKKTKNKKNKKTEPCLPRAMPTPSHAYPEPRLARAMPTPSLSTPGHGPKKLILRLERILSSRTQFWKILNAVRPEKKKQKTKKTKKPSHAYPEPCLPR